MIYLFFSTYLNCYLLRIFFMKYKDEIIEMAWCDKTSFDDISSFYNLNEGQVIKVMRKNLKPSSFKMWRKRVYGRKSKHKSYNKI